MIKPASLTDQLLFTTVRLEATLANNLQSVGTGFFFTFKLDEAKLLPLLITNKHVVAKANTVVFSLHESISQDGKLIPTEKSFPVSIPAKTLPWFEHPDPTVDLCAVPIAPLQVAAERQGKKTFMLPLDSSIIKPDAELEQLSAVEDILMVGYPIGLFDELHNLPLVRRGITASHPAINFNGASVFVIDAACFPGSSGSPVLIVNESMYRDNRGNTIFGKRVILLGVLYGGPQWTAEGKIEIQEIPTAITPTARTPVMINLGYAIKAKEILVLCESIKSQLNQDGGFPIKVPEPNS